MRQLKDSIENKFLPSEALFDTLYLLTVRVRWYQFRNQDGKGTEQCAIRFKSFSWLVGNIIIYIVRSIDQGCRIDFYTEACNLPPPELNTKNGPLPLRSKIPEYLYLKISLRKKKFHYDELWDLSLLSLPIMILAKGMR